MFVLKCVFWLAIVLVAIGGARAPLPESRSERAVAAKAPLPPKRPAPETPRPDERARLSEMADTAAAEIAGAARDHCLAHPLDCLRAAQWLRGWADPEPRR
jgi:hypothetical protein